VYLETYICIICPNINNDEIRHRSLVMNNIAWLESIATKTDYDIEINEILKNQSLDVQNAYCSNNQAILKTLLGGEEKLASKNTIFHC
jgi:hypothetical protein